ncbi:MAG: DNA polymerase III subunit beta [Gammaproteobacteria bacterium]|nr:DNA polymerase III subunit beta [Gammaproteobacteria bacterium]
MKFTITRDALIKPLQTVSGIVERRQTLPILSNVLLKVSGETLTLTSTDLEIEMLTHAEISKATDGDTTLPARKFLDICRALSDDAVLEISISSERATIRSGKSRFVLSTLPAAEFPNIEVNQKVSQLKLPQRSLRNAIARTHFAMAQQDVRYYLNGLLMELENRIIRMVATDGHRLALCETPYPKEIDKNQSLIIPRKAVLELYRLLSDEDSEVEVRVGGNFIQVKTAEISFTTKLIDGRFPDYQNVIPKGGNKSAVCDREALRQALSRVSILSNEKYRGVRMQLGSGIMHILAHNPEQEEAEEELTIDYTGDNLEIGFNVTYLLDALSAGNSDQISLTLTDSNSSCLIQGVDDKTCRYIVMPMRL